VQRSRFTIARRDERRDEQRDEQRSTNKQRASGHSIDDRLLVDTSKRLLKREKGSVEARAGRK